MRFQWLLCCLVVQSILQANGFGGGAYEIIRRQDEIQEENKVNTTLSEYLWDYNRFNREAVWKTDFIPDLKSTSLNPSRFGAYNVQDAVFRFEATESLKKAMDREQDPDVKQILMKTHASYSEYSENLFEQWHIANASGIQLGNDCNGYVYHVRNVATTMDPIYLVVAMIPRAKLWPWVGERIGVGTRGFGVYTQWLIENFSPDMSRVAEDEALINEAEQQGHIDRDTAYQVYTASMGYEATFFGSV